MFRFLIFFFTMHQFVSFTMQYGNFYKHFMHDHSEFVPAPHGHTPNCASKNKATFCDQIDTYPEKRIKNLLVNFSADDFLVDEQKVEFTQPKPVEKPYNKHFHRSQRRSNYNFEFDPWKVNSRSKRQNPPIEENLCSSRQSYINPQAALNSRGDWRFLVNDVDSSVTQLIRTETCSNNQTQCSNCQLPIGYTSRCQQKYAQKRVVALHEEGEKLYTDTFWFPSCCVCILSIN